MQHVRVIGEWIITVVATMIVWNYVFGGWAAHHAESPPIQGLRQLT